MNATQETKVNLMPSKQTWGVCAVAIPRESYYWIEDWIRHHIRAGASKVVLYDNTGSTGSLSPYTVFKEGTCQKEQRSKRGEPYGRFTAHILDEEIREKLEELELEYGSRFEAIRWQPRHPQTGAIVHGQTEAYADFVRRYRNKIGWGLFIDLDEYLYCAPGLSMKKLLTQLETEKPHVGLIQLRQWQFGCRWGKNGPNSIEDLTKHSVESPLGAPKALVCLEDATLSTVHVAWGLQYGIHSMQADPQDISFCHYNLTPKYFEESTTLSRLQPRAFLDANEDKERKIRLLPPMGGNLSADMAAIDTGCYTGIANKAKATPLVSVIMPVRNMKSFVMVATDSILRQSFIDFEFIIVDDASSDRTGELLDTITDPRIIRITNERKQGNYRSRNRGLKMAKGKYICVMDADDIAHPEKISKQLEFMEKNPGYLAAGTDIEFFTGNTPVSRFERLRNPEEIKVNLLKDNVCTHPTLMVRKKVFTNYGILYSEDYHYSADYDLMLQISRVGAITNLPEFLLQYRVHPNQISSTKREEQIMYADHIRLKQLDDLKIHPSIDEVMIHLSLMKSLPLPESKLVLAEKWCNKLLIKNHKLHIFDQKQLFRFLEEQLIIALFKNK